MSRIAKQWQPMDVAFIAEVKRLMEVQSVSQKEIQRRCCIGNNRLSRMLSMEGAPPSIGEVGELGKAFDVKASKLIADVESSLGLPSLYDYECSPKQPARRARLLQAPKPKMLDTSNLAVAAKATPYSLEDEIEQTYND